MSVQGCANLPIKQRKDGNEKVVKDSPSYHDSMCKLIIGSAEALPILCVSDFCERERERERRL